MARGFKGVDFIDYVIQNIAEGESGEETGETYNYYLYVNLRGQALIMREKSDSTEFKYANGGFVGSSLQWTNRTTLSYVYYNKVS